MPSVNVHLTLKYMILKKTNYLEKSNNFLNRGAFFVN